MKRMMSIIAITTLLAGSYALACDTCGCKAKKGDKAKTECKCPEGKCGEQCAAKKAEKAETKCGGCKK